MAGGCASVWLRLDAGKSVFAWHSALRQALKETDLIVIDEIGKIELLSPQFREAVTQALNNPPCSPLVKS